MLKKSSSASCEASPTVWSDECDIDYDVEDSSPALAPDESTTEFLLGAASRGSWLVGLLAAQSLSSLVLEANEVVIQKHPVIVFFLTMLVGAGGNAGNQAAVRVIRGLAVGAVVPGENGASFVLREARMALVLAAALSVVGYCRVIAFTANTSSTEALAVAASLFPHRRAVDRAGGGAPDLPREDRRGRLERGDDDPGRHGRLGRAHHVRGLRLFAGRDVAFIGAAAGGCGVRCMESALLSRRDGVDPPKDGRIFSSVLHAASFGRTRNEYKFLCPEATHGLSGRCVVLLIVYRRRLQKLAKDRSKSSLRVLCLLKMPHCPRARRRCATPNSPRSAAPPAQPAAASN